MPHCKKHKETSDNNKNKNTTETKQHHWCNIENTQTIVLLKQAAFANKMNGKNSVEPNWFGIKCCQNSFAKLVYFLKIFLLRHSIL